MSYDDIPITEKCSVCGHRKVGMLACSDCFIDFQVRICLCSSACMTEHEKKCSAELRRQLDGVRSDYKKFIGENPVYLRLYVERIPGEVSLCKVNVISEDGGGKSFYFVSGSHHTWQEALLGIAQSQNLDEMGQVKELK